MAEVKPKLRVGDTFLVNGVYKDDAGDPVNLDTAGITIAAAATSEDGLTEYELAVEILDQDVTLGGFTVTGDTTDWTPGKCLHWNVRFTGSDDTSWSTPIYTLELTDGPA